jgi:transposase
MKKAHRVALKPTAEQEALFGQHAGYARFAYNWALREFKAGLDVGEWLSDIPDSGEHLFTLSTHLQCSILRSMLNPSVDSGQEVML